MTDIATVLKSLLDSSTSRAALRYARYARQFLGFARIRWNFALLEVRYLASHISQAPTPKSPKRRGLGGYADAKSPAGDCASGLGLVHANHVLIQYNFARVTDIGQFSSPR